MAELPLDQAVPRFKANEDRLDTFVNSATGYTTSGGTSVQSIQQFLASIGSNGIDFVDNAKARFGTGNDLEIYHSGTGSFIKDTGTGDLTIDGSAISIQTASAERVSISASGINVTGTVEFDGLSGTGAVTITDIADEDNMASNSATKLATQQSIKAYVDTQVATIPTGDITSVVAGTGLTGGGTTGDVTLNVIGGTGITANADDIAIDATVATLTSTQTFTNKTLTSAVLNTSVTGTAVLDEDDMTSNSSTKLATQQSIKAYVDANAGGGGLPTTGGTMTGDILFNDGVKAKFGASNDLQIWHNGTDSYVYDTGEGDLILRGSSNIKLQSAGGTALSTFTAAGASTLYYSAAEKLATTSSGIDVTGNVDISGAGTRRIDISNTTLADTGEMATLQWDNNANFTIQGRTSAGGFAANWYSIQTSDTDGRADAHIFYTDASAERMRIDSSGVDVTGDVNASASLTFGSGGAYEAGSIYADANWGMIHRAYTASPVQADHLFVNSAGTERMRIDSGGIDVTGALKLNLLATTPTWDTNTRHWTEAGFGARYDSYQHRFDVGTSRTEAMRINQVGNVGIGTTSPQVKLQTTVANSSTEAIRITNDADAVRTHMFPAEIQAHNSNLTLNANDGGFATVIKAGGAERMRIDSGGIDVTGSITATGNIDMPDSSYILMGASDDLQIYHDGSNSYIRDVGTGNLYIDTNSGTHLYANGNENMLYAQPNAGVHLYYDNVQKMQTTSNGISVTGATNTTGTSNTRQWSVGTSGARMGVYALDNSTMYLRVESGSSTNLQFGTYDNIPIYTITNNTVRTTLLGNGNFGIGTTAPTAKLSVAGDLTVSSTIEVGSLTPNQDGAIEVGVIALGTPAISSTTDSTGLRNHIIFDNPNGAVGRINTLNSSTSYLTSSDYRLKTDVVEMTGSIDRVKALRPVNFEWVVDGTRVDGFLAHEAQEVIPEAVDGEKDAMREQKYVESEATGDIYTPAVVATYETIQVELTPAVEAVYETVTVEISPAVDATYDEDGNELTPAIEAVTEEQEQLVTPAVEATYEEQQQELTPAIDEVIHSTDVEKPDELEEGQAWRETTEKVMATRQVPDYQGIDQSKIVPLLTSALQDAIAKIEALETRLEALEA